MVLSPSPVHADPRPATMRAAEQSSSAQSFAPFQVVPQISGEIKLSMPDELQARCNRLPQTARRAMQYAIGVFKGHNAIRDVNEPIESDRLGDFEFAGTVPENPHAHHVVYQYDQNSQINYISVNKENGDPIASVGELEEVFSSNPSTAASSPAASPDLRSSTLSDALSGVELEDLVGQSTVHRLQQQWKDSSHATQKRQASRTAAEGEENAAKRRLVSFEPARQTIPAYDEVLPHDAARKKLNALPAGQKNATALYMALNPVSVNRSLFHVVLRDLRDFDGVVKNGFENAMRNFTAYARVERDFLSNRPRQDAHKHVLINHIRMAFFPNLPSQVSARSAVGEPDWQRLGENKRPKYLAALADFDVHLACNGKNLVELINGPDSARHFINEKLAACQLNAGNPYMKSVLRMWRQAAHPLTLDRIMNEMVEGENLAPGTERNMKGLVADFAEYAYVNKLSDDEFLRQLKTAKVSQSSLPSLAEKLAGWTGAEENTNSLISILARAPANAGRAAQDSEPVRLSHDAAYSAIGDQRWGALDNKTKTRHLAAWAEFDAYIARQGKNLDAFMQSPEGTRSFIEEKRAAWQASSDPRAMKSALGMWRQAAFDLSLDKTLNDWIARMPLGDASKKNLRGLAGDFAEYACVHGLSDEEFLQQLRHAKADPQPSLEIRLSEWTGSQSMTQSLIGNLARTADAATSSGQDAATSGSDSQSKARTAIGEADWQRLGKHVQTRYLAAWAEFDAHLAGQGKNLAALLQSTSARQDFIAEKQAIYQARGNPGDMRGALGAWRKAAFPLPLDDTLSNRIDRTSLADASKRDMKGLIADFSEYACMHGLSDEEFLRQVQDKASSLQEDLIAWTRSPNTTKRLIGTLERQALND